MQDRQKKKKKDLGTCLQNSQDCWRSKSRGLAQEGCGSHGRVPVPVAQRWGSCGLCPAFCHDDGCPCPHTGDQALAGSVPPRLLHPTDPLGRNFSWPLRLLSWPPASPSRRYFRPSELAWCLPGSQPSHGFPEPPQGCRSGLPHLKCPLHVAVCIQRPLLPQAAASRPLYPACPSPVTMAAILVSQTTPSQVLPTGLSLSGSEAQHREREPPCSRDPWP